MKELKEEMKSLKASTTRQLRQTKVYWKKKVAEKDESIATLKVST